MLLVLELRLAHGFRKHFFKLLDLAGHTLNLLFGLLVLLALAARRHLPRFGLQILVLGEVLHDLVQLNQLCDEALILLSQRYQVVLVASTGLVEAGLPCLHADFL